MPDICRAEFAQNTPSQLFMTAVHTTPFDAAELTNEILKQCPRLRPRNFPPSKIPPNNGDLRLMSESRRSSGKRLDTIIVAIQPSDIHEDSLAHRFCLVAQLDLAR